MLGKTRLYSAVTTGNVSQIIDLTTRPGVGRVKGMIVTIADRVGGTFNTDLNTSWDQTNTFTLVAGADQSANGAVFTAVNASGAAALNDALHYVHLAIAASSTPNALVTVDLLFDPN